MGTWMETKVTEVVKRGTLKKEKKKGGAEVLANNVNTSLTEKCISWPFSPHFFFYLKT